MSGLFFLVCVSSEKKGVSLCVVYVKKVYQFDGVNVSHMLKMIVHYLHATIGRTVAF